MKIEFKIPNWVLIEIVSDIYNYVKDWALTNCE